MFLSHFCTNRLFMNRGARFDDLHVTHLTPLLHQIR